MQIKFKCHSKASRDNNHCVAILNSTLHCVGIKEVPTSHCGVLFLMILLSVKTNVTMDTDSTFISPIHVFYNVNKKQDKFYQHHTDCYCGYTKVNGL